MKSYLIHGDCTEVLNSDKVANLINHRNAVVVTDPPFNVGYHYNTYRDNLTEQQYLEWLRSILSPFPSVVIAYPEILHKLSVAMGRTPNRVVSWVYNSNTPRQHRDIAFYDISPNFKQVTQPYKNPEDKRIKERIAQGHTGAKIYDWWYADQVKNVSKEKTIHPCQMPQVILDNIVGVLPKTDDLIIIDPFMGSGTTGLACKKYNVDFLGIEMDADYYRVAESAILA